MGVTLLEEPLLQNTSNKYTSFPVKYQDIYDFRILHNKTIWHDSHIDMAMDIPHWKKLSDNEQYFIKHILAFFASSDGIVMENISTNFSKEIQWSEVRSFYAIQMFIEDVHNVTYSKLIETYVKDEVEKNNLFNAIETMPAISKKAEWAKKWIDSDDGFATRLFAFTIVEGLFFSGAFCSIYWIAEKGIMPGLCMSNKYIARDEGLHVDFAVLLYTKYIVNKLPAEQINNIMTEAVEIEKEFIINALPCSLLGMNSELMIQYIEYVANRILGQLGYGETSPYKGTVCPFEFMNKSAIQSQVSFFDERSTDYQKKNEVLASKLNFNTDDDF